MCFFLLKKKKRKRLRHCLRSTLKYHYDCLICVWVGWGEGDSTPSPTTTYHNNLSTRTPLRLARISKIKKSLLIINFPIVFQFATFNTQKLHFIRTLKKAKKIMTLFKVYLELSLWLFNLNFEKEISLWRYYCYGGQ